MLVGCGGLILGAYELLRDQRPLFGIDPGKLTMIAVLMIGAYIILGLSSGYIARRYLARRLTPKGERRYWDVKTSKQYRSLKESKFDVTIDFARGALDRAIRESNSLPKA
jgi:hypothetical protein